MTYFSLSDFFAVFCHVIKQKVVPIIFFFVLQPETTGDGKGKYNKEGEERNTLIGYSALIYLTRVFTAVKNGL